MQRTINKQLINVINNNNAKQLFSWTCSMHRGLWIC